MSGFDHRKTAMKAALASFTLCAALLALTGVCDAQTPAYPTRAVRVIVPYPPGGPTDVIARLAAQALSETLGQQFFVENLSGASGARGAAFVASAPPDGYTLMFVTNDLQIAAVTTKVQYDPVKNFAPISIVSRSPSVVLIHPAVPAKTMQEFITLARADPAKYSFAGMSQGQNLLASEKIFHLALKLPIIRIPFPGAAPIITSTLAGHTLVGYIGLPPASAFIKDGTLRALAVTSPHRSPIVPDVPTLAESGFAGLESELIVGVVAPAGTPRPIVELLTREMAQFVARPQTRERLDAFGFSPVGSTPEEFAALIKSDMDKSAAVVRDAGLKFD
jgi:tripartite-type tricarboxylate transporter receptor subunit TctC